ncbi:MAG TPA: FAD-dependent oxidoreductase [Gemmatimonadota bacterium]|nr:FAD-dependent oxidoreductase [Gemmatimonadota bacterium]
MSIRASDVVVVGAGIVGAACALECVRAGLSVALIDRGGVGGGATAAGMGHIVIMDDSPAQFELTRYSQHLWDELAEELPEDAEFERPGTIWVAADDEEMSVVQTRHENYRRRGIDTGVLDARGLAEAEPQLRSDLAGGLRVPGDSVVYPPGVAHYLVERFRDDGGTVHLDTSVTAVESGVVTLQGGVRIAAGFVVLAAGHWAGRLAPSLPLRSRKGHLLITDRYPGFVRHQLIELGYLKSAHASQEDTVAFNIQPRRTGQLLVGSSRQFDEEDSAIDSRLVARMIARTASYLPAISGLSALRIWTGHRAATPDKLPLIGPLPGREGVIVATGHEGLGITTSLGTARLVCSFITSRAPEIAPDPYLPSRFGEVMDARRN